MEQWRDIKENTTYQVSNLGRIRNKRTGTIRKTDIINSGYARIKLPNVANNGDSLVHRMVAKAFCTGYAKEKQVDHIDGNRLNNRASNLRWVTVGENIQANGKRGTLNTTVARERLAEVQHKQVNQIEIATNQIVATFNSLLEAEKYTKVSRSKISMVCNGYRKSAGGYHWEYIDASQQYTQKTVQVYCVDSGGNCYDFSSISKASEFIGVDRSTLSLQFKKKNTGFTYRGYNWYRK